MRKAFVVFLLCVLGPPQAFAQDPSPGRSRVTTSPAPSVLSQGLRLLETIERKAGRGTLSPSRGRDAPPQQPSPQGRSWVERHPALFGTFVGAGAGAVSSIPQWTELYCATGGDEDCLFHGTAGVLFGAGVGAGIGSLVGYFVGK